MYRKLTQEEINKFKDRDCYAKDWSLIEVKDEKLDFARFMSVRFSGSVKIGLQNGNVALRGGVRTLTGIKNVLLHNCIIGDNVYINNVNQYIANYNIGDRVRINNIECLIAEDGSTFGNGTEVAVLNETGGREVPIFDYLSSHLAYVIALYRHRTDTIEAIKKLIAEYTEHIRDLKASVGADSVILNCGEIVNVKMGVSTQIDGAARLIDGSINSTAEAPSIIGRGVMAEHFIICNSTKITDGVILEKCFIGQGTEIGKQYSAENSLFFSNCVGMHGESCSIFAGPYTVTHHKSTLLIAGMYSFLNAGSGSNQSNHMYKLGPIHQGIVERGSKTTSDSYILWPLKIGAFSLVMGRHYNNADTSSMPFSYLIEGDNESVLVPGVNLRSVGTIRDAKKWPKRDKRKCDCKFDQINFNLLSPYTINKMLKGEALLKEMVEISGEDSKSYSFQSCVIKNSSLKNGLRLYNWGITKFLGNSLIKRLEGVEWKSIEEIRDRLRPTQCTGSGGWTDVSGLIAPKSEVNRIIDGISSGEIATLEAIHHEFVALNKNYYDFEWTWVIEHLTTRICKSIDDIQVQDIVDYIKSWKFCVLELDKALYQDAHKEFTLTTSTGFGIDGGPRTKKRDFEAVRGDFDKNDFVIEVLQHMEKKSALADEFLERMSRVQQ
ncbi:MAG: DUF4954 family protein [Rikenellaceae bacterium]